jgi:peptidoglycan-N-acetylglucosamine deacetylase
MLSRFVREWSIAVIGLCIIVSLLRIGSHPSGRARWAGNESTNTQSRAAPQPSANPLAPPKEAAASISSTTVAQGAAANRAPPPSAPTPTQAPTAAPSRSAAPASEPQPGLIIGRNSGPLPDYQFLPATKNANIGSDVETLNTVPGNTDVNDHLPSAGGARAQSANSADLAKSAQNCPGNPDALGTSRVLAIDPAEYPRIGHMQYPQSLPLADKEVVLTFDDGPLPRYSNQVLDILASECVKATYFLVGEMARAYPATVRRIFADGHTIGTHSEDHPFHLGRLPIDKMRDEIDRGIADVSAALGDRDEVAPFFRIPGLDRSDALEQELAAQSLVVFSSDTVADDWHHHIKPSQIIAFALSRLEARGKGILLLHDIHPTTVAALPGLLRELKQNGFHIVQVVPAASAHIQVASKPSTWVSASATPQELTIGEDAGRPVWPHSHDSAPADDITLPAPDASAFEPDAGLALDSTEVQWPEVANAPNREGQLAAVRPNKAQCENAPNPLDGGTSRVRIPLCTTRYGLRSRNHRARSKLEYGGASGTSATWPQVRP